MSDAPEQQKNDDVDSTTQGQEDIKGRITSNRNISVNYRCSRCFKVLTAASEHIGRSLRCPFCYTETEVPADSIHQPDESELYGFSNASPDSIQKTEDQLTMRCPLCRARVTATVDLLGTSVECPDCQQPVLVERIDPFAPAQPALHHDTLVFEGDSVYGVKGSSEQTKDLIPLVCRVCGTRMYAHEAEVGSEKQCPDCDTMNVIPEKRPEAVNLEEAPPDASTGFEGESDYGTAGEHPKFDPNTPVIPVVCGLCHTRMYATVDQVGELKQCPDCWTSTRVPDLPPEPYKATAGEEGELEVGKVTESVEPRVITDYRLLKKKPRGPGLRLDGTPRKPGELGNEQPAPPVPPTDMYVDPLSPPRAVPTAKPTGPPPVRRKLSATKALGAIEAVTFNAAVNEGIGDLVGLKAADDLQQGVSPAEFMPGYVPPLPPGQEDVSAVPETSESDSDAKPQRSEKRRTSGPPQRLFTENLLTIFRSGPCFKAVNILALLFGLCLFSMAFGQSLENDYSEYFVALGGFTSFAVLFATFTSWQVILQATSDGLDEVDEWPENEKGLWLIFGLRMTGIFMLALSPGAILCWILLAVHSVAQLTATGPFLGLFTLVCFWILLPLFTISVVDSGTIRDPISARVMWSVARLWKKWLQLYALTGVLIAGYVGAITAFWQVVESPIIRFPMPGVLYIYVSFLYFRLVGRLAWLGDHELREEGRRQRDNARKEASKFLKTE
jgi:hypothetical protein